MEFNQIQVLGALQLWLDDAENAVLIAMAIFMRISALLFFLPGLGEQQIPMQIKLAAALAFAVICWPAVLPMVAVEGGKLQPTLGSFGLVMAAEAVIGLLLGLATRFMIFALQTAGTIAAQTMSVSQMFGGIGQDPAPTISTLLALSAIALAVALGLHVKAAALIIGSYNALPFGVFPLSGDVAEWATARTSAMFSLAISLSLPFLLASFMYNLALGFINRAMPQMMVSFVGMPAIIIAGMLALSLTIGAILTYWHGLFDAVLASPLDPNL